MSLQHRLATLALTALFALPVVAHASDDTPTAPYSRPPTRLNLCKGDNAPVTPEGCKQGGYDKIAGEIDKALQAALAKTPANVKPLLKRDQGFFNETMLAAAQNMEALGDDYQKTFAETLRGRIPALAAIADGFGRTGLTGDWADAFGTITVTAEDGGAYRVEIDTKGSYGSDDGPEWACGATALVKPAQDKTQDGWLSGPLLAEQNVPALLFKKPGELPPIIPPTIRIRRQGATLRLVASDKDWARWDDETRPSCKSVELLTGTYFASGKGDASAAPGKVETTFVKPTFDCAQPSSASDEEICSDPDLVDNDQRLNRAWKALLPRLDDATRRALMDDQHRWVKAQAFQYVEFMHPIWGKQTSFMHHRMEGRDKLDALQRERIALLEGFDETRTGFAGVWLGYNAILKVTTTADGGLEAKGWKWQQGDWKLGCDYDLAGKVTGGSFRSNEERTNPDTLERDHAMLIVNRLDEVFAAKRPDPEQSDKPKCKRVSSDSSTARLFPAKPSPDIDSTDGSIR
jgi:uncharacterized protein YecT (DUF1311 family)